MKLDKAVHELSGKLRIDRGEPHRDLALPIPRNNRQPFVNGRQKSLVGIMAFPKMASTELLEQRLAPTLPFKLGSAPEPKLRGHGKQPGSIIEGTDMRRDSRGRVRTAHRDPRLGEVARAGPGLRDVRRKTSHDGGEQQVRQRPPHCLQESDTVKTGWRVSYCMHEQTSELGQPREN